MRAAVIFVGLVGLAACGGKSAPARRAEPTCRDVAVRGEGWVAVEPEPGREEALRWLAEVIDLCQKPGLALRARTCLAGAPTFAGARACPSLPEVGIDIGDPNRAPAPTCDEVVAHVMALADAAPGGALTGDERTDEERAQAYQCSLSTPAARRCVIAAGYIEHVEQCYLDHEDDEDDDELDDLDLP